MADIYKSSSDLKIDWQFADGDTRTQSIKNPKYDLTAADLRTFETATVASQVIIGDKTGAAVTGIKTATIDEKTIITLDIS